ncbi:MAG: hypothetical protein HY330_01685 [Chloroflexi bacterium]|nr:hypothetical protein [Chloroflexota bacterium]
MVDGLDISQALSLTWLGAAAAGAVMVGLALILGGTGRVFIAQARDRARRLARSQAEPGPQPQPDDAALVAALAVALAAAEEGGAYPQGGSANGSGARAAWALAGRERLMNNQPPRQGR